MVTFYQAGEEPSRRYFEMFFESAILRFGADFPGCIFNATDLEEYFSELCKECLETARSRTLDAQSHSIIARFQCGLESYLTDKRETVWSIRAHWA